MSSNDFLFTADRCEIHARIPTKKYIDVRRYMLEVVCRQSSVIALVEKGAQQFGDARGLHSRFIVGPSMDRRKQISYWAATLDCGSGMIYNASTLEEFR